MSGLDATRQLRADPRTGTSRSSSSPRSPSPGTSRRPWRRGRPPTWRSPTARASCSRWCTKFLPEACVDENRRAFMRSRSACAARHGRRSMAAPAQPRTRAGRAVHAGVPRAAQDLRRQAHAEDRGAGLGASAGSGSTSTVSVGPDSAHPSLPEHFVRYIALYKDSAEIARVYLHPVYSAPSVTFTIALDEGGCARWPSRRTRRPGKRRRRSGSRP